METSWHLTGSNWRAGHRSDILPDHLTEVLQTSCGYHHLCGLTSFDLQPFNDTWRFTVENSLPYMGFKGKGYHRGIQNSIYIAMTLDSWYILFWNGWLLWLIGWYPHFESLSYWKGEQINNLTHWQGQYLVSKHSSLVYEAHELLQTLPHWSSLVSRHTMKILPVEGFLTPEFSDPIQQTNSI